jgi:tetratricopeptide (TPR) repeat protein
MRDKGVLAEIAALILSGIIIVSLAASPQRIKSSRPFLMPPTELPYFTFGYKENIVDSLWLRLVQDLDYCDSLGLIDDDALVGKNRPQCTNVDRGWAFNMLNSITTLAPKFKVAYSFGAIVLSVFTNDKEGARIMFERAIENFPDDWGLQFRAAYHYLYELNQPEKAAELLVRAGKNGAPQWVFPMAARLYSKEGRAELGRAVLKDVLENPSLDENYAKIVRERLDGIDQDAAKP